MGSGPGAWSASAARAASLAISGSVYDVARTGYPQRMRDHDERERIRRKRELERELDEL